MPITIGMKTVAFFISIFVILTASVGHSKPFQFISYIEFQRLTEPEQKIYINLISDLVLKLDEDIQNDYLDNSKAQMNSIFNLLIQRALAQTVTPSRQISKNPTEESAKIGIMMSFINAQIRSVKDNPTNSATKSLLENDYFETLKRLSSLSEKKLDSESIKFSKKNIQTLKNFWPSLVEINPELAKYKVNTFKKLDQSFNNINGQSKSITKTKSLSVNAPTNKTKESNLKKSTEMASTKDPSNNLRCMYAGFVIKETTCTPYKILPNDFKLEPLKQENFKCKTEKEILCNPILFGYTDDNKPYCTTRSTVATKNCKQVSNNIDNQKRILELWKNSKNKNTIDQFQNDLQTLCEDTTRVKDIKITCKVAIEQFNGKIKSELPVENKQESPALPITKKPLLEKDNKTAK